MITPENKVVEAGMLIRQPAARVYEAITDPRQTTNFWFTESTGPLQEQGTVTWTWGMYGASTDVKVLELAPEQKVLMLWGDPGAETTVEWTLTSLGEKGTFLRVREAGIKGTDDEVIRAVKDSTGGFVLVLAGMKAWLEHGIRLNLVGDRFPAEMNDPGP